MAERRVAPASSEPRTDLRPLSGRGSERDSSRHPGAPLAPELTPAERAAALSELGRPAPAGAPLDASRLDAARERLRAAAAPAEVPAAPQAVDPGRFDAAQARLRAARGGGRRTPR